MPGKSAKYKPAKGPQPQPAQIKSLERLIESRDYRRAIERAQALVQRFPDHGGTRRLLVEALALGKGRAHAALAAYQWAERRPNSLPALESLFRLAVEGEHLFLARRTLLRLGALGAETSGFDLADAIPPELLEQPGGPPATPEQLERFDIGKLHLEAHDFAAVLRALDGAPLTPARNNRALALFHLGRIEEALHAFLDSWQQDPGNLFALSFALQLRLYGGDETGARGLSVPLARPRARRAEDAQAQCTALLLIREDQAALDAFQRSNEAPWRGTETADMSAGLLHLGACAASRLGRRDQARTLWTQVLQLDRHHSLAEANLGALDRDRKAPTHPEVFDQGRALPLGWTEALIAGGATNLESRLEELSASDVYLEALYLGGDPPVRGLVTLLLKHRLKRPPAQVDGAGQRDAAAILRELARLPIGTSDERLGFLTALRDQGLIASDESVQLWNGEELRQVNVIGTEIYRDPAPSDLPEDLESLLRESVHLFHQGQLDESEAHLQAILERVPDYPVALGNLAGIRAQQDRGEESRALLRRTIAAHPDYLFARCNLAGILIQDGELDEAQGLLAGLAQRPRLHIQEAFALYGVLAMLSGARGEDEAADALIASLEQMTEDEDDERLLALAKRRVALATPRGRFGTILKAMLSRPPSPHRPKRR